MTIIIAASAGGNTSARAGQAAVRQRIDNMIQNW